MKILQGKNLKELSKEDFTTLISSCKRVEIDLGTGDGRFVYKNAISNPDTLYVGIDPSKKQLETYSSKANRKRLKNAIFLVGSAEELPLELEKSADVLHVILPWGSLLSHVIKPDENVISKISRLMKAGGVLKVILGYTRENEPSEYERLDLRDINGEYIEKIITPKYKSLGMELKDIDILNKKALGEFETTWCKKLSFGKTRPIFYLEFVKQ